jgi:hypothetical protein
MHLVDVVGDQAVGFAVDGRRGVRGWCFEEAEHLAPLCVDPVAEMADV